MLAQRNKKPAHPRSESAPPILHRPRKQRQKQWTNDAMLAAIEAIRNGEPILHAARTFGVPRKTLQDRIHGRVSHVTNPGPKPYLTQAEEHHILLLKLPKLGMVDQERNNSDCRECCS